MLEAGRTHLEQIDLAMLQQSPNVCIACTRLELLIERPDQAQAGAKVLDHVTLIRLEKVAEVPHSLILAKRCCIISGL